jgi:hypothetical protein
MAEQLKTTDEKTETVEIKKVVKSRDWVELNLKLNAGLKVVCLLGLILAVYAGGTTYANYAHSGPSCDSESFDYWLNSKTKGKVVSVHKKRLQSENGTTSCFGSFKKADGSYEDWSGSITELSDGSIIGHARLL